MAIAVASPILPPLTGSVDMHWNMGLSYCLAIIWLVLQVVAVVRYRWRGLWLLIGLPIVLFWPIVFELLENACRHDKNACL